MRPRPSAALSFAGCSSQAFVWLAVSSPVLLFHTRPCQRQREHSMRSQAYVTLTHSPRATWRAALGEEAFNWPEALQLNTMFSAGLSYEQRTDSSLASRCPVLTCARWQTVKVACEIVSDVLTEQGLFRLRRQRRWESRRRLSPLEARTARLSLTSDAIFMCCNSQRWAYTVLGGPAWVCWSWHHLEEESLWLCVRVCERTALNVCQYMGLVLLFACSHLLNFDSKLSLQHALFGHTWLKEMN